MSSGNGSQIFESFEESFEEPLYKFVYREDFEATGFPYNLTSKYYHIKLCWVLKFLFYLFLSKYLFA